MTNPTVTNEFAPVRHEAMASETGELRLYLFLGDRVHVLYLHHDIRGEVEWLLPPNTRKISDRVP